MLYYIYKIFLMDMMVLKIGGLLIAQTILSKNLNNLLNFIDCDRLKNQYE